MKQPQLLWVSRPKNKKTGSIPTAYVGSSKEEAWASCEGCSLRDSKRCYAWTGTPRAGFGSVLKKYNSSAEGALDYSWDRAVRNRAPSAKAIRFGALGDPSAASKRELYQAANDARRLGLAVIGYTHHWRKHRHRGLKQIFLASCDTMGDVDTAVDKGWTATVVLSSEHEGSTFETPAGNKGVVCPAQTKGVTCNDCRMCDPEHPVWAAGKIQAIGFIEHGPSVARRKQRMLPRAA